jgi:hypothetical protein
MIGKELVRKYLDLRPGLTGTREAGLHLLQLQRFIHFLAGYAQEAQIVGHDGQMRPLKDSLDTKLLLHQVDESLLEEIQQNVTDVPARAGNGTRPAVTQRVSQARDWMASDTECSICGHIHQNSGECGVWLGQGKFCTCTAEVTA